MPIQVYGSPGYSLRSLFIGEVPAARIVTLEDLLPNPEALFLVVCRFDDQGGYLIKALRSELERLRREECITEVNTLETTLEIPCDEVRVVDISDNIGLMGRLILRHIIPTQTQN
ncbi:MAG: hypothetical protein Q7R60_03380 [bacterium]|nr:hypothetical protein [bacterium]